MHPRPRRCCSIHQNKGAYKGRFADTRVQMCQRLYISRVIPSPSEPLHTRFVSVTSRLMCIICTVHEYFIIYYIMFFTGTSANSLNFQIYLLEGLHRWNQDRAGAALATGPSPLCSYSGELLHCVNRNYLKLYGSKLVPEFSPPSRYTGKLLLIHW